MNDRRRAIRRLLDLLRPLAPLMALSASARVINQGLGVAIPAVAAVLVVEIATDSGMRLLFGVLAGLAVVKGAFRYLEQFTGHAVAFRLLAGLRVETYRSIVPLAPAALDEDRTGDLVARVIGDIDRVEPFYAHTIAPLASGLLVPILAAAGLAIWVDPLVAAVFVPFPLLILIAPWVNGRRVADLSARARDQNGVTAAVFTESIQGAREIAIFDARDTIAERVEEQSSVGTAIRSALARVSAVRLALTDLLAGLAVVAVTWVAVARFEAGLLTVSAISASIVVAWVGTGPARALEDIVPDLEQALAAAARLFELSDRDQPVTYPNHSLVRPEGGSLSFEGVGVVFPDAGVTALETIDVDIEDKAYVALVGPSGSGKSTLVELLLRFRDPDRGRVSVGGADVKSVEPGVLRGAIALAPQRPDIFYGTISDNLRLARQKANDDELWHALDRAGLGEWAHSLPRGLETRTGELGETLSGGQRQRLALARLFLREPEVLVLDEATSELDIESEHRVLSELSRERGRRTVVVVAHRLESVVDADEILVMDRGRLVERGTHRDLVAANGTYAGLWQRHLDVVDATLNEGTV